MTRLGQQMLDELERHNYPANAVRTYIRTVEDLARCFRRRPERLGPEHIRQYQAHLFRDRQLAANTVAQRVAALRFFCCSLWAPFKSLLRLRLELSVRKAPTVIASATTLRYHDNCPLVAPMYFLAERLGLRRLVQD